MVREAASGVMQEELSALEDLISRSQSRSRKDLWYALNLNRPFSSLLTHPILQPSPLLDPFFLSQSTLNAKSFNRLLDESLRILFRDLRSGHDVLPLDCREVEECAEGGAREVSVESYGVGEIENSVVREERSGGRWEKRGG